MSRKRMIDPSFWLDEKLGECTRDERLLFMGLISSADDEGYGRANPKLLRSSLFPYDDLRVSDLEKWLSRLGGLRLIVLYKVNGQAYYHLPNFSKYQTINRPTPSSCPKPEKEGCTAAHGGLTEHSLSTHGALTEHSRLKEIEENRKEKKENRRSPLTPQGEGGAEKKQAYAEFVAMTPAEYEELERRVGKAGAKRCVEILDNYKGSKGKSYKSDYRAILSWVIARYEEEPKPEPEEATAYYCPEPDEDALPEIPEGATLKDILPPTEEASPW